MRDTQLKKGKGTPRKKNLFDSFGFISNIGNTKKEKLFLFD